MSRVTTVKCDVCGKIKGESNRWFAFYVENLAIGIYLAPHRYKPEGGLDLCGEQCLHKAIGEAVKQLTGAQHE